MISQKEKVLEKIQTDGEVSNFWAIDNYILRLGAIIHELRKDGMAIKGSFGKELGKDKSLWKNFYYIEERPLRQTTLDELINEAISKNNE